ncbi:MAG TPA: hypothetical protein VF190_05870 [Rhodothermales bacterium]
MEALIRDLIPHTPKLGLYVAPDIPDRMLQRALSDYGGDLSAAEVIALYDATRFGTGGDGALFAGSRFAFQNTDLERGQVIRYTDVVGVRDKRRLLGGRYVEVDVNRGRATISLRIDFSARPGASRYVARFLHEAMLIEPGATPVSGGTDWKRVRSSLDRLMEEGSLSEDDYARILALGDPGADE